MRTNRLRALWRQGRAASNAWLTIDSAFVAELLAHQGYDSLTVDMQHGVIDYTTALAMLQALSTADVTPLVRVPWNEPGIIMKMLDAGAYGIICPMINSRAEAEAFAGACRYPPRGYRSYGPRRAALYAGDDYALHANDEILAIAMIETVQAVENLDAILSTPGIDAIYIGPADLTQSYGGSERVDLKSPQMVQVLDHILATAQRYSTPAGLHCGAVDYAQAMIGKGFQFVTAGTDSGMLEAGARVVCSVLGGQGPSAAAGPY